MKIAFALALVVCCLGVPAAADDFPLLPNPTLTPGAVDPSVTVSTMCDYTTRTRRHVSSSTRTAVFAAYGVPEDQRDAYELDHLVPLAIGGSNVFANLWPQPLAEAERKDVLERELQRQVCHGLLSQAEAQREVADDWVDAYDRYVLGGLGEPETVAQAPKLHRRVSEFLKARARRLIHSWIFGSE